MRIVKNKNSHKGSGVNYHKTPGSMAMSRMEIYDALRFEDGIEFVNCTEHDEIFLSLWHADSHAGDTSMLYRIIRGGGFCEYIRRLQ
jgi:hypothetical protein